MRLAPPPGLSPKSQTTEFASFTSLTSGFASPTNGPSALQHEYDREFADPVAGSGKNVASRSGSRGASRGGKTKKGGNVFQRDSPNAKKVLRSLLLNFTDDSNWTIRGEIDLRQHQLDTGIEITNAVLQEVCVMAPEVRSLNLTKCGGITDVGLWAIARYCTQLKELKLSECHGITNIGLRSLAMKCTGIEVRKRERKRKRRRRGGEARARAKRALNELELPNDRRQQPTPTTDADNRRLSRERSLRKERRSARTVYANNLLLSCASGVGGRSGRARERSTPTTSSSLALASLAPPSLALASLAPPSLALASLAPPSLALASLAPPSLTLAPPPPS
jgi:hypothetical protein